VRRFLAPLLLALSCVPSRGAPEDTLARFNVVAIKAASTSVFVATITMTMPPFVRKKVVYSSTYVAKVSPFFFYGEKGRIWIAISDDDLRRAAKGESVDFKGQALSEGGETRRVEGHAVPTGPTSGRIRVRVFVTRRIALTYDTTYELQGAPRSLAAVTAK
jgi:hypothetical protein